MSRRPISRRRRQRGESERGTASGGPQPAPPVLLMEAVRLHQAGRLAEARALYERVLATSPRQADALHLLGVIAHQQGEQRRARSLIGRAIALNDRDPTYHNNLGTVALAMDEPAAAMDSFRRALELNPLYAEAHNNMGNAHQATGDPDSAIASYRRALQVRPGYAEAQCNLGRALHTLGDLEAAARCYRHALSRNADYLKARKNLGDVLAELGQPDRAEVHFQRALALEPDDCDCHAALAALWERANKLDQALCAAETALARDPRHVRAIVMAARCERRLGRPQDGLARLERMEDEHLDGDSRAFLAFEKATILDRLGDYRRAFRCFVEGNRLLLASPPARRIDPDSFPRQIDVLTQRFTPAWVASWTGAVSYDGASPVFLVGFPRSGTTLLDQVLDAHPALAALEEKPTIDAVKRELERRPEGYPGTLASLSAEDIHQLRRVYFDEAAKHGGADEHAILVDKMPLNTIDVGLIHRLFPQARILLALRHPCDVVLSGFMQAFRPNPAMVRFGTLEDSTRLYADVMALWRRYAASLPLAVLTTRYEDLVADFAGETRRILDFLHLPWDDAVLSYRQRAERRAIATPSYHQVVQPIYSGSVGRWLNYRAEMAPVLPLLDPYIRAFGYELPP